MASNYASIREDNEREYGAGVGRWGPGLLTNRYDDRTHFIFELLQNAEDALARRSGWQGSRSVRFDLSATELRVTHFGQPFDISHVRGICGIGESTKDITAIGRFGIGFKSVYAFTNRPEVHSGEEDFAIESYVWPTAILAIHRQPDETVFILPLNTEDGKAHAEIAAGLQRLGARTLLFLRQIEEIAWSVEGGPSGLYIRGKPEEIADGVKRIILLGEEDEGEDVEETWLLFSREARTDAGIAVGLVQIAFSVQQDKKSKRWSVKGLSSSPLVAFFPTVVETHLGFYVQGPYRTTPSRDNVPRNDPWNQHLVSETSELLVEALRAFRQLDLLGVDALLSLPLDPVKFSKDSRFAPLFTAVRNALKTESLLPAAGGGHTSATSAKLARTQDLRELLASHQLADAFDASGELRWLSGDITYDRTPELRQFLIRELEITEVTPESLLLRFTKGFLERQSDEWIGSLYEFLHGLPALLKQGRLKDLPIVRLEDGSHVLSTREGRLQAFLPGPIPTEFPTVKASVCSTEGALALLVALGLTKPDPVDDVIWNVLPRYREKKIAVSLAEYGADIGRFLSAAEMDSKVQREKLIGALRQTAFVRAIKASDGTKWFTYPENLYVATERLKTLFTDIADVFIVDDSYECLRGEPIRDLLEACGATRYLQPIRVASNMTEQDRQALRRAAGWENCSGGETVEDSTLMGLDSLLAGLSSLASQEQLARAEVLWDALCDMSDRRGPGVFSGTYRWFYFQPRSCSFNAAFVQRLNTAPWVPDATGCLQTPDAVVFDTLGWKPNPFLLSKICFKPPIIDQLAKEAGIEPGLLDLLKALGLTSEAGLRDRLGMKTETPDGGDSPPDSVADALKKLLGGTPDPTPPIPDPSGDEPKGKGDGGGGNGTGGASGGGANDGKGTGGLGGGKGGGGTDGSGSGGSNKRTPGGTGGRPFISYVATRPDANEPDPDGLDQNVRMALESQAIDLILSHEPKWQRTPANNPGFDLLVTDAGGMPVGWCEVKAMTGSLRDRPVGLSHTQFECAQEHGQSYWLYVVEHADKADARVVRIQDPAGKARTFTFDHGWLDVAASDNEQELSRG